MHDQPTVMNGVLDTEVAQKGIAMGHCHLHICSWLCLGLQLSSGWKSLKHDLSTASEVSMGSALIQPGVSAPGKEFKHHFPRASVAFTDQLNRSLQS